MYLGAHNIGQSEPTRILVQSRNLIRHRDYNEERISDDIGLIVFDDPVELSETINVVALPRRGPADDYVGKCQLIIDFDKFFSG